MSKNELNGLALKFIVVLYEQLRQFPKDFFLDEISKDSFLVDCLYRFKEYIVDANIDKKTKGRIEKLF